MITNKIGLNSIDSHQSQPRCVVKFVTFRDQDSFYLSDSTKSINNNTKKTFDKDAYNHYTVVSDILDLTVSSAKNSPIMSGEMTLSSGDLNYLSLLAPGDHCMIWLMNDETKYQSISSRVYENKKANEFDSGLKFIGRVNSVRAIYGMSPNGIKTLRYVVTIKGFSEFQSMIYYNPFLYQPGERGAESRSATNTNIEEQLAGDRFFSRISESWRALINSKGATGLTPSDLMPFFIETFLGVGAQNANKDLKTVESPNEAFVIPSIVANILGISSSTSKNVRYIDILKSFIGIQKYDSNAVFLPSNLINPSNVNSINKCKDDLTGAYLALPDTFSGQTIWQIMQNHLNSYINEMFVSVKSSSTNGDIFPSFVARQIPFTSKKYEDKVGQNKTTVTKFSELPVWRIDEKYPINSYNFGTSDSLRFNFIQIFGAMIGYENQDASQILQSQIQKKNFTIDPVDISRNGVKMQVLQTNVDIIKNSDAYDLSSWAALIGDFYHNGHLKMTGSVTMPGIQLPISVGDNINLDGKLFHIESVVHSYSVDDRGLSKTFNTTLMLSNGIIADSKDNYITLQPSQREFLPDKIQSGYSDEEIYINNARIRSSGGDKDKK